MVDKHNSKQLKSATPPCTDFAKNKGFVNRIDLTKFNNLLESLLMEK